MADALTPRQAGWIAGAVALAAGLFTLNHYLTGVFYDDGLYAGLAWAMAHGHGFVHPNLPGTPAAVHFPPLFPVVLIPFFATLSIPAAAFAGKVLNVVLFAAGSALVASYAVRTKLLGEAPPWVSVALVAAAAIAIPVLTLLGALMSEPLFALLLVAAVMLVDESPLSAGVCVAAALLTRSIGVDAGAGILLYAWRRGASRRQLAEFVVPVLIAGAAWGFWVLRHKSGIDPAVASDYGSYFETVKSAGLGALGSSTTDLPRPLSVLTLNWVPSRVVYYALGIPALLVGLYGLALFCVRSSIGWTLVFYLAILGLWPFPPDRFLWAVLPWLGLAWAAGAFGLWRRIQKWPRVALVLLAVALGGGYARYEIRGLSHHWWDLSARSISDNFAELVPAIDSLPAAAVLATDNEPLIYLATGRQSVPFYLFMYQGRQVLEPTPGLQRAYLERYGVTHVLLSGTGTASEGELRRLIAVYPTLLAPVRIWPGGRTLYEVRRDH